MGESIIMRYFKQKSTPDTTVLEVVYNYVSKHLS